MFIGKEDISSKPIELLPAVEKNFLLLDLFGTKLFIINLFSPTYDKLHNARVLHLLQQCKVDIFEVLYGNPSKHSL